MLRRRIILLIVLSLLTLLIYAASQLYAFMEIGTAYNAKTMCSCVFVAGRDPDSVKKQELYTVPFGTEVVDKEAHTVRASIFGLASRTAFYRPGLGCTLVNGTTLQELQSQPQIAEKAALSPDYLRDSVIAGPAGDSLRSVLDRAFSEKNTRAPIATRAVVVLHRGRVIAERYAPGFTRDTRLIGWSMTKSVTQAMIGLLVLDGKLSLQAPTGLAEWQADARKDITLDHLLRMSSGLKFEERYDKVSDATRMLMGAYGAGDLALQSLPEVAPGTKWSYSSGTTNILQVLIRRQFAQHADYLAFPHERLFHKIGMYSAVIEPDASGTYVGSSYMYATARDWAKFGQLYLQDGVWNGERILPEGWSAYAASETPHSDGQYGAHFWLELRSAALPPDIYNASGFEGQTVAVIPSREMVIVRLGCTSEGGFDVAGLVEEILGAVEGK